MERGKEAFPTDTSRKFYQTSKNLLYLCTIFGALLLEIQNAVPVCESGFISMMKVHDQESEVKEGELASN